MVAALAFRGDPFKAVVVETESARGTEEREDARPTAGGIAGDDAGGAAVGETEVGGKVA